MGHSGKTLCKIFRRKRHPPASEGTAEGHIVISLDSSVIDIPRLWNRALGKLEEENETAYENFYKLYNLSPNDKMRDLAARLEGEMRRRLELMKTNEWAVPWGLAEDKVKVRKRMSSIAAYAGAVKKSFEGLVGLDPTGYAKLGWIPFSIALDLASLENEKYADALDASEKVTRIIYRYRVAVETYEKQKRPNEQLEVAIVSVYSKTLELEVMLCKHFSRNTAFNFLRGLTGLDDWKGTLAALKARDEECEKWFDGIMRDVINKAASIVSEIKKTLEDRMAILENLVVKSQLDQIGDNPLSDRTEILDETGIGSALYPGAGTWLLEDDIDFKAWMSSTSGVNAFWLSGSVGSGKTFLSTLVIEKCLQKAFFSQTEQEKIAYFYCSRSDRRGTKVSVVLRSFLRQICWSSEDEGVDKRLSKEWTKTSNAKDARTEKETKREIRKLLQGRSATFIVDALDECADPSSLVAALMSFANAGVCVRLFFSSRPNIPLSEYLKAEAIEEVAEAADEVAIFSAQIIFDKSARDMKEFIETFISRKCAQQNHKLKGHTELIGDLETVLKERSDVCFRWTLLQLGILFPPQPVWFDIKDWEAKVEDLKKRSLSLTSENGTINLTDTYREVYKANVGRSNPYLEANVIRALQWMMGFE